MKKEKLDISFKSTKSLKDLWKWAENEIKEFEEFILILKEELRGRRK